MRTSIFISSATFREHRLIYRQAEQSDGQSNSERPRTAEKTSENFTAQAYEKLQKSITTLAKDFNNLSHEEKAFFREKYDKYKISVKNSQSKAKAFDQLNESEKKNLLQIEKDFKDIVTLYTKSAEINRAWCRLKPNFRVETSKNSSSLKGASEHDFKQIFRTSDGVDIRYAQVIISATPALYRTNTDGSYEVLVPGELKVK